MFKVMVDRVKANKKIDLYMNKEVLEWVSDSKDETLLGNKLY
jgi:hypothetical protein